MSQVIYARVPDSLKEAADSYAHDKGVTLTAAVVDLLERGLAAASDEESTTQLQLEVAQERASSAQLRAELERHRGELAAVEVVRQRAGQTMATCPNAKCQRPVTAYQLLAVGRCGECGEGLSNLIAPATAPAGLDQRELLLLIGAIGAVIGAAWLANKNT